jgi:hypothetical protein
MPQELTCFACELDPTQQCPRCGRPYCDNHGEEVCDACLEPATGLPSFTLYRGSLLALLIGTALAVWLILQPPGDGTTSASGPVLVTPTEPALQQPPTTIPGTQQTPAPGTTPATGATPEPTEPTGPAGTMTYTVQGGDTLFGICVANSSLDPQDCVDEVLELNSISDPGSISPGETLVIPQ